MAKKNVAIMIDSECGWSEEESRSKGFNFVPISITMDGKTGWSGVDMTLDYIYDNLKSDTVYKTAATPVGMIEEEYDKALKSAEHVIFIPLSKHLSSQINSAKLAASDSRFEGKVTVYDSEFIGPWLLLLTNKLIELMDRNAKLNEFIEILDEQRGDMFAWLFPRSLDRVYASGRLTKAQYMAGNLLKITPVMPVINGSISGTGIVKTRSVEKALNEVVKKTIEKYNELIIQGKNAKILTALLGRDNEEIKMLESKFEEKGYKVHGRTWVPAAIVGHVGLGGVGAGVAIEPK